MNKLYRQQVELLLKIVPIIAETECFAIHGGTAINLYMLDLPRYSVDIGPHLYSTKITRRSICRDSRQFNENQA